MATNWVDEVLSGATSTGSKSLNLSTGNTLSVSNSSSENIFTVTSDTTNGGYTSILGIEGQEAVLFLGADNADDAGDVWELHSDTSGNFKIGNRTSGTGSPTRSNTITNTLTIDSSGNATVLGDLTVTGGKVTFGNSEFISNETDSITQIGSGDADNYHALMISSSNTYDAFIVFASNLTRWSVGYDASDTTDHPLLFNQGTDVLGTNTMMKLASDGDLTIAGDLTISGGNITNTITCDDALTITGLLVASGTCVVNGIFSANSTGNVTGLATATSGIKLGNNYIYASDGDIAITLDTSSNVKFTNDIVLSSTKKLRFDGSTSGDTYIRQSTSDILDIVVGGDTMMKFTEGTTETIAMSAEKVQITGTASYQPNVIIENDLTSTNSENPAVLTFAKTGEAAADGDNIGRIVFQAIQEGGSAGYDNAEAFAYIQGEVVDSVAASEAGQITWHVFSDSSDVTAMTLAGNASDARCALTLGADGAGCDFKAFGETASNYMLWDQSEDLLQITTTHNSTALRIQSDAARSTNDAPDVVIKKNSTPNAGDYLGSLKFTSLDAGGSAARTYAEIDTYATEVSDNAAEGSMFLNVLANGTITQSLKCRGTSDGLSEVECTDGVLQVGVNTVTQGKLIMKRKDSNEFPYIEMVSANGTSSFLFVANDGTLRINSAAPTANTDGAAV